MNKKESTIKPAKPEEDSKFEPPTPQKMKTESAEDITHQSGLAVQQLKRLKRELEILYKDLIRITFNSTPVGD